MISLEADSRWTTVSICNWGTYQATEDDERTADGQPTDSEWTASGQPADTNKKGKKVQNGENDKKTAPKPPEGAGRLRQAQDAGSGMAAIMGKWPGDETDAEIADALDVPPPPASVAKSGNGQPRKSKTFTPDRIGELEFPPKLDNDTAREALAVWLQEKIDRGQAYKSTRGPNGLLKMFKDIGAEGMESAIAHAISCNYAGVLAKNANSPAVRAGPAPKPTHCKGTCGRELAGLPGLVLDGLCPDCYAKKWD